MFDDAIGNAPIFPLSVEFPRIGETTRLLGRKRAIPDCPEQRDESERKRGAVVAPDGASPFAVQRCATSSYGESATVANVEAASTVLTENVLLLDGLRGIEVSCRGNSMQNMYTRVRLAIPWTPTLYVSVRRDYALRLKCEVNFALMLHGHAPANTRLYTRLNGFTRPMDQMLWQPLRNMRLMELQFANPAARATVRKDLRANATAHAQDYQLFAVDDAAFNVALSTYVNDCADGDGGSGCGEGDNERHTSSSRDASIDLSSAFQLCAWCRVDTGRGNYIRRLSQREIALNRLSSNPLLELPVLSYDIETIARNENVLPRGVEIDQRLSSLALTVHLPTAGVSAADAASQHVVLAYAPHRALREQETCFAARDLRVLLFDDERELLLHAVALLRENLLLASIYELDRIEDASRIASILLGYNSWNYDHLFLITRLVFYGEDSAACRLLETQPREPRFCDTQISFDLMKHMIARYRVQIGSVSLANAAKCFFASDVAERDLSAEAKRCKMQFNSVAIRRLYYDTFVGEERFDVERAFDCRAEAELHGLNLLRVLRYNVQDCTAVYHLYANTQILDNAITYSRHFFTGLIESSYVGNNRLLCNAFTVRALQDSTTVVSYVSPLWSTLTVLRDKAAALKSGETESSANRHFTPYQFTRAETQGCAYDESEIMRVGTKAYIGGINTALSGVYAGSLVELDYLSFYPTQALANNGSKETVRVYTVHQLLHDLFAGNANLLDTFIAQGVLRVYEYEPDTTNVVLFRDELSTTAVEPTGANDDRVTDSSRRFDDWSTLAKKARRDRLEPLVPAARLERERIIRGIDALASDTLAARNGWYEGVEFSCTRELVESSRDIRHRRIIVTRIPFASVNGGEDKPPFLCSLWRYYLTERAKHKRLMSEAKGNGDAIKHQFHSSQQLLYKVIANTIYGVLNFPQNVMYSPAVAALITLMSRKTFHETTTIVERYFPRRLDARRAADATSATTACEATRCKIVYRDTDGMLVCANRPLSERDARDMATLVNERLPATRDTISGYRLKLELERANVRSCTVMGRKKYWLALRDTDNDVSFVTKGFEKNAQPFVKHIVRLLQLNLQRLLDCAKLRDLRVFRLAVTQPLAFYVNVFAALHSYYERHGIDDFTFAVALNPQPGDGELSRFVQTMLREYDYDVGDRASCLYALRVDAPNETRFCTTRDFDPSADRVNYFKCVRRFALYFLQMIEGFKRNDIEQDESQIGAHAVRWTRRFHMSSSEFESCLLEAYELWLGGAEALSLATDEMRRAVVEYATLFEFRHDDAYDRREGVADATRALDRLFEARHIEVLEMNIW